MDFVITLVLTLLYAITWAGYSKFQFIERDSTDATVKADASKKWHKWKFYNQIVFFAAIYLTIGIELSIAFAVLYQLVFNSLISAWVEGLPVYHLGSNPIDAKLKEWFGEKKAYFVLIAVVATMFVACAVWPHALDFLNYK